MFHKLLILGCAAISAACIAQAGPPLICHPHNIGSAKSLPWGNASNNWDNPDPNYNVRQLSADTLRLLDRDMPAVVRMETMRRAAVYGAQDHAAASELLAGLRQRAETKPDAWSTFDYGYFAACLKQMEWRYKEDLLHGVDGAVYVKKSLALRDDPEVRSTLPLIAGYR